MTILFGSILATTLVAQLQGGAIEGRVVDDQGKPVADVQVELFAPSPLEQNAGPVEVRSRTNSTGRFHLVTPPLGRTSMNGLTVWAYRPGSAITAAPSDRQPLDLVLRKPQPRTVRVEGPEGRPIAGAVVSPRFVYVADRLAAVQATMAAPLGVRTGPDGQAVLGYLAAGDKLVSVQVKTESAGTQELQLLEVPRRDAQPSPIAIRLKPTNNLAGHVRNSAGKPVAGQVVEIWSKGSTWSGNLVVFDKGPLRTAEDGSFRTPDNLFVGSQYRVAVRAPGMEPILSKWLTIRPEPRVLLPLIQRPLRTLSGRVADRQGKPLFGIEVFQSGDGPERTKTTTDRQGRFTLGGFHQGSVFLFARCEGFRFFGRQIKPGEDEITIELTRRSERPTREMRMLPEPISFDESRELAKRLVEPWWEAAIAQKNEGSARRALRSLVAADPAGVLERLRADDLLDGGTRITFMSVLAPALARSDAARAIKVAESIEVPAFQGVALARVAETLPSEERERKLALLSRAVLLVKQAKAHGTLAEYAERLYALGEHGKAQALMAECARQGPDSSPELRNPEARGMYAARLARYDLPAALAIAKELPEGARNSKARAYWNIVLRLADENPAEAQRVLRMIPQKPGSSWLPPAVAWKMAQADPDRARRLVEEAQHSEDDPQMFLFLALGLKAREPSAAEQVFWKGIAGIDRLMKEGIEYSAMRAYSGVVLPVVEQLDPALVAELFWRAVATRPPVGNPAMLFDELPINLTILLSFYDREVAAAILEPVRAQIDQTDDEELAGWGNQFLAWSLFDPRAAVARMEQIPIPKNLQTVNIARERAAQILGLPYEDRWRTIHSQYTDMRSMLERDIR
jgi:hypothetical protein